MQSNRNNFFSIFILVLDYKRHKQRNTLVVRSKNETPRKNPFDENSLSSTAKIFNGAVDKLQSTAPTTMNNDANEFCDDPNVRREVIDSLMKVIFKNDVL